MFISSWFRLSIFKTLKQGQATGNLPSQPSNAQIVCRNYTITGLIIRNHVENLEGSKPEFFLPFSALFAPPPPRKKYLVIYMCWIDEVPKFADCCRLTRRRRRSGSSRRRSTASRPRRRSYSSSSRPTRRSATGPRPPSSPPPVHTPLQPPSPARPPWPPGASPSTPLQPDLRCSTSPR